MAGAVKWTVKVTKRFEELFKMGVSDEDIANILTEEFRTEFTSKAVSRKRERDRLLKDSLDAEYNTIIEKKIERARIESKKRQVEREEQRLITEEARWRDLLSVIEDSLKPVVATMIKPPKLDFVTIKPATKHGSEEAILLQSDIHMGKRTARYDINKAEDRVRYIANKVINITQIHRAAYPIDILNIFYLGDILDGDQIYKTQAHNIDASMVYQLIGTVPTFLECFHIYSQYFKKIRIWGVPGNHGRFSRYSNEDDNFDRIFYHILKIACDAAGLENIEWNIAESWNTIAKVQNTRFMLIHGNQIRMHMNLPWYGITTKAQRWFTISDEQLESFDVLCMGHFHTQSNIEWNKLDIYTNGTFVDYDRFGMEMLGYESSQHQWFFGVNDERVTWQYKLGFPSD